MGSINSVPVVSQAKSLVQVIAGDEAGAKHAVLRGQPAGGARQVCLSPPLDAYGPRPTTPGRTV